MSDGRATPHRVRLRLNRSRVDHLWLVVSALLLVVALFDRDWSEASAWVMVCLYTLLRILEARDA